MRPLPRRSITKAMTRPSGLAAAGVGFGASVLVLGAPVGIAVGAGVGALAWGVRVAVAIPWRQRQAAIDPFTVQEPWRTFVFGARRAQRRFDEAVGRLRRGPLQDRLGLLGHRIDTAIEEAWRTAQSGQTLSTARRNIDVPTLERQLVELEARPTEPADPLDGLQDRTARTVASLRAQLDTAARLDRTVEETRSRLGLLDARLGEAVTRAIELSARAGADDEVVGLGRDVDDLIDEMEALRQALVQTSGVPGTPGTGGALPPGSSPELE